MTVTRSDEPVAEELWGTYAPTDPGTYEIKAWAAGKKPWIDEVVVGGAGTDARVVIPSLDDIAGTQPDAAPVGAGTADDADDDDAGMSTQAIAA